jgi:hypothetical protein
MNLNNDGYRSVLLSSPHTQTKNTTAMCADGANFFLLLELSIAQHSIIVTLRRQIESYKSLSFITAPPTHEGLNLISLLFCLFLGFCALSPREEKKKRL